MGGVIQRGLDVGGDLDHPQGESHERRPGSPHAQDGEIPFTTEMAEVQYQRLGRWSGADASPEKQAESRQFSVSRASQGSVG